MRYGFIADIDKEDDYVFGGGQVSGEIINPSGNWKFSLPNKELQNINNVETFGCVSFTILNCIEILIRHKYDREENWSDRFLAGISDTKIGGNSPRKVADFLRKVGVVKEDVLPFSSDIDSFSKYYQPIPPKLYELAREFIDKYEFKYEKVTVTPDNLKNGLKRAPLGVSMYGWVKDDNGLFYKPDGTRDTHFTTLIGYKDGIFWEVFDTYDNTIKQIAWDTRFELARRYYIIERTQVKDNWLIDLFKRLFFLK